MQQLRGLTPVFGRRRGAGTYTLDSVETSGHDDEDSLALEAHMTLQRNPAVGGGAP